MTNLTFVTGFIFMGFPTNQNMYILHSVLFSFIHLWTLLGNILITMITTLDQHFHTPIYFFLKNLSFLGLCLFSIAGPKSIVNFLTHNNSISFLGCVTQVLLLFFSGATKLFLLTAMAFDCYAAICHPVHYEVIMNLCMCMQTMAVSWLGDGLTTVMHTASTLSLSFCGSSMVHQFFCNIPQLLAISCSENLIRDIVPILISVVLGFCCFIFIVISYVYIFFTTKKLPSKEDQSKAYFICLPHLVVIVLFLSTGFTAFLKPISASASLYDLLISLFSIMVPLTLNPFIYCLRNKAMKKTLGILLERMLIKK